MASSLRPFTPSLIKPTPQILPLRPSPALPLPRRLLPRFSCLSATTTSSTSLQRSEEKNDKAKSGGKARVRIRLNHQVAFGESVAILGSSKELGSWKKKVPMDWTEDGWVCEVRIRGGESAEYKFVIVSGGEENVVWEDGGNRVLKAPTGGVYDLVCHWNRTDEAVELLGGGANEDGVKLDSVEGDRIEDGEVVLGGELSPFVEQWQGREISFMQSNEHRNRESERRWDTSGLEGVPLKLVEGDQGSRNWWRKVHLQLLLDNQFLDRGINLYGF